MVSWISNSHRHPKSFTLTEEEISEWSKKWDLKNNRNHMECYENNTRCEDEEECEINAEELNAKYSDVNRE